MGKIDTKNLKLRFITGIVYTGLILLAIFTCNKCLLNYLLFGLSYLAVSEYLNITQVFLHNPIIRIMHSLASIVLIIGTKELLIDQKLTRELVIIFLPYLMYIFYLLIGELFRNRSNGITEIATAFFGHLYIAVPIGIMLGLGKGVIVWDSSFFFDLHTFWLLPLFLMVWVNDTGAYLIGSCIGRTKLSPKLSPKKTVEGFVGGILFTILVGVLFAYVWKGNMTLIEWICLSILVAVVGTFGDLFESYIKRCYNQKDSGSILPGHGGILDRIDSLLFVAPIYYTFLKLFV